MTGYQSKKGMARDKLEQAAFDAWWDTQPRLNETNPASVDSFEYWAWEGWHAALAQPAQEPVAWQFFQDGKWYNGMDVHNHRANTEAAGVPVRDLYTTPPQRTWVEPTGNEWFEWWRVSQVADETEAEIDFADFLIIAQAVMTKLKENNNG